MFFGIENSRQKVAKFHLIMVESLSDDSQLIVTTSHKKKSTAFLKNSLFSTFLREKNVKNNSALSN